MLNFWKNLPKGFLAMAPMAGITDSAFRQMCVEYGCDVTYSEMASTTALFYDARKAKNLDNSETLKLLEFDKKERPYVVQLFGSDPEHFEVATKIVTERIKPDGIDINLGCPVRKIQKQGAGAVLMNDMKLAKKVIEACIKSTDLPVSIKTRTKSGETTVLEFLDFISDLDIKALMIHGRTLKQMFSGDIDVATIREAKKHFSGVLMANGGINNFQDAKTVLEKTGADGLGIARGAMGRPWIFEEIKKGKNIDKNIKEIQEVALKHLMLVDSLKGKRGVIEMRKHLCWYVQGLSGARKIRQELVQVDSVEDVMKVFKQ